MAHEDHALHGPFSRRGTRPLVLAHRGASAERPENTLAAFGLAEAQGADGIELDVMRCGSGEVVVFHDDDLDRLTGAPGSVRSTPLSVLRTLRVDGEPIPTLDEVFSAIGPALLVNVELKSPDRHGLHHLGALRDDGLAEAVAECIAKNGVERRVLVSSFDPLQLVRFRRAQPNVPVGLLFHAEMARPLREGWLARWLGAEAVHPEARQVTAAWVAAQHAHHRLVNAWTVDDPNEMAYLATVGVDALITNRPALARVRLASASG